MQTCPMHPNTYVRETPGAQQYRHIYTPTKTSVESPLRDERMGARCTLARKAEAAPPAARVPGESITLLLLEVIQHQVHSSCGSGTYNLHLLLQGHYHRVVHGRADGCGTGGNKGHTLYISTCIASVGTRSGCKAKGPGGRNKHTGSHLYNIYKDATDEAAWTQERAHL